ncbi:hypothetical protein [Streptomyces sp. NPDC008121]|uniref:hypothetical protein n=1 Tax=Streptomyces sp. NPDC008121 TaxID=3364809 RepID=UPI0036F0A681
MPTTPTPADRPADQLRAAAEKLRAAAATATEGAWAIWRDLDHQGYITVGDAAGVIMPPALQSSGECNPVAHVYIEEDAEHIALLHPGVGLALADWLDRAAAEYDATVRGAAGVWSEPGDERERDAWVGQQTNQHALVVARQLLGTTTCPQCGTSGACNGGPCPLLGTTSEAKRNEIRQSYSELAAQAREDRDHEGAADVELKLRDREEQWRREDAAAVETAEEREPIQLRWGLDDVMYGDDDTTTVLLSGPGGEPYWVELDPERTAALRNALAGPESTAPPAPADRAATRDRIRRAIGEASGFTWLPDELMEPDEYGEHADAVLAVLDAPADRAAILNERAAFLEGVLRDSDPASDPRYCQAVHDVALGLRRLAGEAAAGAHHPSPRIRLDDLTSDALDQLYERAERLHRSRNRWADHAGRLQDRALTAEARVRELEAALNRVRALADIAPTGAQGPTFAAIDLAIQNNLPTT